MDEFFEHFLKQFGPPVERRWVPQSSIDRYRGKLPEQLLTYWEEHGWTGYADGLLWTVDPQEYEPVVDAWIGDTKFMEEDTYHLFARGAFGNIYFIGERSGNGLHIVAPDSIMMKPSPPPLNRDRAILAFFGAQNRGANNLSDVNGERLFTPALSKLGRLKHDEMYGFVPALALGGPATLDHLQKVKAVEHLVLLAQLGELRMFPG